MWWCIFPHHFASLDVFSKNNCGICHQYTGIFWRLSLNCCQKWLNHWDDETLQDPTSLSSLSGCWGGKMSKEWPQTSLSLHKYVALDVPLSMYYREHLKEMDSFTSSKNVTILKHSVRCEWCTYQPKTVASLSMSGFCVQHSCLKSFFLVRSSRCHTVTQNTRRRYFICFLIYIMYTCFLLRKRNVLVCPITQFLRPRIRSYRPQIQCTTSALSIWMSENHPLYWENLCPVQVSWCGVFCGQSTVTSGLWLGFFFNMKQCTDQVLLLLTDIFFVLFIPPPHSE